MRITLEFLLVYLVLRSFEFLMQDILKRWTPANAIPRTSEQFHTLIDAYRFRKLRAMHWHTDQICVVNTNDLPPGIMTYSGQNLDDVIDSLTHHNELERRRQETPP
jgi:hypothetical protein